MLSLPAEFAHSALDAAPDAMIIIDESGVVRFANRQAAALFGYPHQELIGNPVELLIPERFRSRHIGHRQGYASSVRVRPMGPGLKLFGLRKDGSEFPVEISLSPIQNEERTLVAAAIRDVSERMRVEAELIAARETADRARAVADRARETADRANQAKTRFLATASHDLRQPLQTLSLLNGTLRRIVTDWEATQALAQEEQAIGAMSRLLNALLDISKLESGAVKPEPTDFSIAELFHELGVEFGNLARGKGLQFLMEDSADGVHADRALIEQILRNLISNAIKYTRRGHVALRCSRTRDATVLVEIIDSGIGIPPSQLQYIFDEFYQVGVATNSTREGYGLGLSIVQRIVKLLDLKLDVRSEVGKGSIFSLALPIANDGVSLLPVQVQTRHGVDDYGDWFRVVVRSWSTQNFRWKSGRHCNSCRSSSNIPARDKVSRGDCGIPRGHLGCALPYRLCEGIPRVRELPELHSQRSSGGPERRSRRAVLPACGSCLL